MEPLLHRMVLVRKGNDFKGTQPLGEDFWEGKIVKIKDGLLEIKIAFGTARQDRILTLPFGSKRWKLRFPEKK